MKPLKAFIIQKKFVAGLSIGLFLIACVKTPKPTPIPSGSPIPNLTNSFNSSTYHLFNQALQKVGLGSILSSKNLYTIFASTDSAMMAANLSKETINTIKIDSLRKIIQSQIIKGYYSKTQLELNHSNLSFLIPTLLQDSIFSEGFPKSYIGNYPNYVYIGNYDKITLNGLSILRDTLPILASNGCIYGIKTVLKPNLKTIYGTIKLRKELSLYITALQIIADLYTNSDPQNDFYSLDADLLDLNSSRSLPRLTLLIPTNQAFVDAGLPDAKSIMKFCRKTRITATQFINLDSILKLHILNKPLLIQDILYYPNINNGIYNGNNSVAGSDNLPPKDPLLFFNGTQNQISIQWNLLQPPAHIIDTAKNIITSNGIIHEVDKLFYPL